MAKKPDMSQLLLQHGERIGLGVAVFLSVLLIFLFLFGFGFDSGLLSGSPTEKAAVLSGATKAVEGKLNNPNNVPGDSDKPPPNSRDKLIAVKFDPIKADDFRVSILTEPLSSELGRRQPKILRIEEGATAVARVQVKTFNFAPTAPGTPPMLYVYRPEAGGTATGGVGGGAPPGAVSGKGGPPPGMGGQFGSGFGKGSLSGFGKKGKNKGLFDDLQKFGDDDKKDRKVMPITTIEYDKGGKTAAMKVRPVRMAIIAASFPYRAQVDQFKRSLNLKNTQDVLNEAAHHNPKEKNPRPQFAFRFLGVVAERRELDIDGKPVTAWKPLDLNDSYKPYVILTGRAFEPDDKKLSAVMVPGLTMPRLLQFNSQATQGDGDAPGGPPRGVAPGGAPPAPGVGGMPPMPGGGMPRGGMGDGFGGGVQQPNTVLEDQYPTIESDLQTIKDTLEALKDKDPAAAAFPPRFTPGDDYDIFLTSRNPPPTEQGGDFSGKGKGPGMDGYPGAAFKQTEELPKHCLVRLVDVTIEPGKTYEYRLQVRMANPNLHRKDTASPGYASDTESNRELKSEWSNEPVGKLKPVSLIVRVDPELNFYSVDQKQYDWFHPKDKDKKVPYVGPYAREVNLDADRTPIRRDRQFYLQAHRWIEQAPNSSRQSLEIGEWVVAERIPVYRGEYVGRSERIDLPVWKYSREDFVIATDATTPKNGTGIQVSFGLNAKSDQPEALLIDFASGESKYNQVVSRTEEKVDTKLVTDTFAGEVLLMNPDGKLIYRETATDANDESRQQRVEKVRARIKKLKEGNAAAAEKKGGFGDMGP